MSDLAVPILLIAVACVILLVGGLIDRLLVRRQLNRMHQRARRESELAAQAIGSPELGKMIRQLQDRGTVPAGELVWLVTATGVLVVTLVVCWYLGLTP